MIAGLMSITGLSRLWVYVVAIGAAAGAVALILLRAKSAGRQAERAERAMEAGRIKDAQIKASTRAPRGAAAVADSLRDGSF